MNVSAASCSLKDLRTADTPSMVMTGPAGNGQTWNEALMLVELPCFDTSPHTLPVEWPEARAAAVVRGYGGP